MGFVFLDVHSLLLFTVQSYEKQIWHCRVLSVFVGFCQFLSVFGTMLFLAAKLRKEKLALSVYVSLCQSMSLYVTFRHIASFPLLYNKGFILGENGLVPILIYLGPEVIFCAFAQFFAGIGPAHFPAETTRPLGRGCLPFSPSFSGCKDTKRKFGTVRICPHMSENVRICPFST